MFTSGILLLVAVDNLLVSRQNKCPSHAGNNAWWGLVKTTQVAFAVSYNFVVTEAVELLREALISSLTRDC